MSATNKEFKLEITNFDNAAMVEDPDEAVAHILEELAKKIRRNGIHISAVLKDVNDNTVGEVSYYDGD
jgi:hypothetical protein